MSSPLWDWELGASVNDLSIRNPLLLVGIGGAGCKIAKMTSGSVGSKCLMISGDKRDLLNSNEAAMNVLVESGGWVNPSSYKMRSFAALHKDQIASALSGFSTVIVISNLAGRSGTALAPLLCRLAKESNAAVISVAIMPFRFEKDRLFSAGTALRRVREASDSVIVMDNDAFFENNPEMSQEECYRLTNNAIVEIISSISGGSIRQEINVLCTSKSMADSESSLRDTVAMLYQDVPDTSSIKRTMVYVMGGDKVPMGDLNKLVGCVQGIFKEDGTTEVAVSSVSASDGVRVHVVASAPQRTRFDRYDPLGDIIPKENVLDWDELDSAPDIQLTLPGIE